MTRKAKSLSLHARLIVAALLGVCAIVLVGIIVFVKDSPVSHRGTAGSQAATTSIDEQLRATCAQFGITEKGVRLRKVTDKAGRVLRMEHRIAVPQDFSSFEFNSALNRRVGRLGARVVGTEKPKDHTVTLQVMQDDRTLMSVILEHRQ
jgi:hypothetical protein